jgi:transaldolase
MASKLDQLRAMTVVVADTGDIDAVRRLKPQDCTTNPSLLLKAVEAPAYAGLVEEALHGGRRRNGSAEAVTAAVADRLAVAFGTELAGIVPGRVSTEVDADLSFDTEATIAKAREVIAAYAERGVPRERILIKIASTWEGIKAAEILQKEGIHCNLTLLFGLHQAIACAEAKVTLISPFVGRILDWYKKSTGKESYAPTEDPGVVSVTRIYEYYKHHGYKTEVMGASFRNLDEIKELAGCDLLTISTDLLADLAKETGDLPRKLDPKKAAQADVPKIEMNETVFRKMHEEDKMAKDKLAEGIDGFSKAITGLEKSLTERLSK